MTTEDHATIDFIAYHATDEVVQLVIVEHRPWGTEGLLLSDLQAKLDTYLQYVTGGQLAQDHPQIAGKSIRIELHCSEAPGQREREFLEIVVRRHLAPAGIALIWQLTPSGSS